MKKLFFVLLLQYVSVFAFAQHSLNGVVTGDGETLVGASVVIGDTFYGVSTDSDGRFELRNLRNGNYTIKVSFIGYEPQELTVNLDRTQEISVVLKPDVIMTEEIIVSATRVNAKSPFAYSNISKDEITKQNMGHDIPYLLQLSPSFVVTSDAGAGVGYTNFRIRGTDLNRINVTVNGIPLNDAESHGTWFVDQPDLASSLDNIQIQRGVGTSTNGAAAFGATINLQTNTLQKDAYAEYNSTFGSFNTFKNSVSVGTGLINKKFTFDTRLSKLSSDGFIDRAFSDLKSFFVSGGYYTDNTILKVNVFSGLEKTYQSWEGVPSVRLKNDLAGMQEYEDNGLYTSEETQRMINSNSRTYNYYTYKNQIDYYQQDHYHLHFSHKLNTYLNVNIAGFYTRGSGYYENFKARRDFADYQLEYPVIGNDTIFRTNLVNQKWLKTDFYGLTYALRYNKQKTDFTFGGGWNTHDGDHFGKTIWAQYLGNVDTNNEWYRGNGLKKDFNVYTKLYYQIAKNLNVFADLQYRYIDYKITGIDDDLRDIAQQHDFNFFNPKFGLFFQPKANQKAYISYAIANREPSRSNYTDASPIGKQPVHETLHDWELGYSYLSPRFTVSANLYYMNYKNQLALTGQINDVGAAIMVNVDESYRAGIELQTGWKFSNSLQWNVNATFSRNKINNFTEHVDNWDTWGQEVIELGSTDLSFSPNLTGNSQIIFTPIKNIDISLVSSYVGKQYIDNTSNSDRMLDAYFVNNLKADYSFKTGWFEGITLHAMVNNLLNEKYESNAWVYSYYLNGKRFKQDGYFPQAGRNFMVGASFKF